MMIKTSVTSKDSDQPVHPPSITMILVYVSLDHPEAHAISELSSDCEDAQADLSLCWSHESCNFFSCAGSNYCLNKSYLIEKEKCFPPTCWFLSTIL